MVGTGELEQILSAAGIAPRRAPVIRPFVILNSRPEGDAREAAGRFSKDAWDGAIADLPNYLYDENTPRVLATPKHSAYIKIAEGCDHPCAFCIIPQLRGKFRSRRFESVIAEAQRLAHAGCSRNHADRTGHHLLRRRSRAERWSGVCCWNSWRKSKSCAGCASSTPIPTKSPASCWRPSPHTRRFAPTSMCLCSTRRPMC